MIFYRVCKPDNQRGLWYSEKGEFTGDIHEMDNLKNSQLRMRYDLDVTGYLSCTETIDILFNWFSREVILELQVLGYQIHVYESEDYKWYERFSHYLIKQETAKVIGILTIWN